MNWLTVKYRSIILVYCIIFFLIFIENIHAEKSLPTPFGRIYCVYYHGNIIGEVNNAFYFKATDVGLKGEPLEYLCYRVQISLDKKNFKFQPLDAYLELKVLQFAQLYVGQFKPPFSMERLIPSPEQDFIKTAMATNLLPEREIGLALFGEINRIEFNTGILNGSGFNEPEINSKKDLVGRLLFKPLKNMRIGGAVYYGWQGPDTNIFTKRYYNFQGEVKYPKFHCRGEYAQGKENDIKKQAYYAQTGYKFTIANKLLQKLEPLVRYEWYNSAGANQAEKLIITTLGTNLFFSEHKFKCQINYNLKFDKTVSQNSSGLYIGLQVTF